MRKKMLFLGLFVGFIFSVNLFSDAIFNFEPEIVDARGLAMGRTSILNNNGSNAIFSNPANLAMLENKNMQFGCRANFGKSITEYDDSDYEDEEKIEKFHFKLNHVSFAMPYQFQGSYIKAAFGAGYRTYYDYGYTFYNEQEDNNYESTRWSHGGLNTLTFGGAVNFQERFYGGLAINIGIMKKITHEWEVSCESGDDDGDSDDEISGSFFTLGGIFKVNPQFSLGLMLRPGFEVKYEEEYVDVDYDRDRNTYKYDYTIPSLFGFGALFQPNEMFLVTAEYQTRGLGNYEVENEDLYGDSDNGTSIRIGAEVQSQAPFRFGFFMNSIPIYDYDNDGDRDDAPKSLMGFTGGLGIPAGPNATIDISAEYAFTSQEDKDDEYITSGSQFKFGITGGFGF